MTGDDLEERHHIDVRMRRAIWRNALKVAGFGIVLLAPPGLLVAVSVTVMDSHPGVPVLFWSASCLSAFLFAGDLAFRPYRSRPRVIRAHTVARGPRYPGLAIVNLCGFLFAAMWSTVAAPGWDGDGYRAGLAPLVLIGLGGGVLGGVARMLRPYRLRVGPEGIQFTPPFGKTSRIDWISIESIGPRAEARPQELSALPVSLVGKNHRVDFGSALFRPTLWVLCAWLNHYLDHPEDRHELATQAGIDRLDAIEAEHRANPHRPWPRWFPPPLPDAGDGNA